MTNTFKRRVYRYCVISAASFFVAFLLYDLGDVGVATELLIFPCTVLWLIGLIMGFTALDTWSGWYKDTSEDKNIDQNKSNAYPITFYTEASLVTTTVVFLFIFTIIRNQPTISEGTVLAVALSVAGACISMGHLSSRLE